ncbi:Gfo/Idh/MocA family protein [Patescibacteria group bacterium]
MKNIKFAVIGCGNIGSKHLAVIDAEKNAELVSISDINIEKQKYIYKLYNNVPFFLDYKKMLKKTQADVVNICTPHNLHAEMAIEVANQKKHILVEKPMALSTAECKRMIDATKKNGVKLMVVKQNRYNLPIQMLRKVIDENILGKIFMIKCNVLWNRCNEYYDKSDWRGKKISEKGALYTQASHFIDLLIWLFGELQDAKTTIKTMDHNIEIEDCGVSALEFKNGILGVLTWTNCVYNKNYEGSITIIGKHGTIKIGGQYLNKIEYWDVKSYPLQENIDFTDKPNLYNKYQGTSSNHDKVIKDVIAFLSNEKHNIVNGENGLKTVEAIEFIYSKIHN